MTAGERPPAKDIVHAVLAHMLRLLQVGGVGQCLILEYTPWRFIDLLCLLARSCTKEQQDMYRLVHAVGRSLYLARPDMQSSGYEEQRRVTRDVYQLVAATPQDKLHCWWGVMGAVWSAPSGVAVVEVQPYVDRILYAAIRETQLRAYQTCRKAGQAWEFPVVLDEAQLVLEGGAAPQEFADAKRSLVSQVAAGLDDGQTQLMAWACYLMEHAGFRGSEDAALLVATTRDLLRDTLLNAESLALQQEQLLDDGEVAMEPFIADRLLEDLWNTEGGCHLLTAAELWPQAAWHTAVRWSSANERQVTEGRKLTLKAFFASEQGDKAARDFLENMVVPGCEGAAQWFVETIYTDGQIAPRLFPPHTSSTQVLHKVLSQLQPRQRSAEPLDSRGPSQVQPCQNNAEPDGHEDYEQRSRRRRKAAAERQAHARRSLGEALQGLVASAASPELAAAVQECFHRTNSSSVRSGAMVALITTLLHQPGVCQWVMETMDAVAQPGSAQILLNQAEEVRAVANHVWAVVVGCQDHYNRVEESNARLRKKVAHLKAQLTVGG
jgi:hypothetical protein